MMMAHYLNAMLAGYFDTTGTPPGGYPGLTWYGSSDNLFIILATTENQIMVGKSLLI